MKKVQPGDIKGMDAKWSNWVKARDNLLAVSPKFLGVIRSLDPGLSEQKGVCGDWSAKDVLSHIVGWEIEVVKRFKEFLAGDTDRIDYRTDDFNRQSVESRKHLSWNEVVGQFESAQQESNQILHSITRENILAEKRFLSWTNTLVKHYKHHLSQLTKLAGGRAD